MKFIEVANAFAHIETIQSRLAITKELAQVLKKATHQEAQELCYLSLGILNPPYIGTQFAIAQKTMTKIVAEVLSMSESEVTKLVQKTGDLGSVLAQYEWKAKESVTVHQLYQKLSDLEQISGAGSQEKKSSALQELLLTVDPVSAKYIVRIVLGTLRLGFSDMTVIDALSWMETGDKSLHAEIEHAYNVCADIGLLAFTLKKEGIEAIKKMDIHVGIPLRPAAAERLPDAEAIIEKLGPCVAEPKLDGFRLQVHIDKTGKHPKTTFFSRNLLDMSAMFPEFLKACAELPVKSLIVDGEAIVYDPNTGTFLPFQETVKRRRKHGIDELSSELPLQLNIFDIMYLDGKSLLHTSQKERRVLLQKVFAEYVVERHPGGQKKHKDGSPVQLSMFEAVSEHGKVSTQKAHHTELEKVVENYSIQTLQVIQEIPITTAKQLEDYFVQEIDAGLEGLVVKKPTSYYQAGKRNFNWIKLKYHAAQKLEDTLDVVVLGYYAGRGKRAYFGIGAFLVGIYNPHADVYETVAKVGTGLSDAEWSELKKKCDALAVKHKPVNVTCAPELTPTVWVNPEIVCEVLADEITVSPVHTAGKTKHTLGLALRFPRFVKYRPDKSPEQTTSAQELKSLQVRTTS